MSAPTGWGGLSRLAGSALPYVSGTLPDGPFVLLDDASGDGATYLFQEPLEIITVQSGSEVVGALQHIRTACSRGYYAAGYLAYEAGWALHERQVVAARSGDGPLLWFGVFAGVHRFRPPNETHSSSAAPPCPQTTWGPAEYREAVARVLDYVSAGDVYQINLTFPLSWHEYGDPLASYQRWRRAQRAGWGAVVSTPDCWLLSTSPELFFSAAEGQLYARPMKGTSKRGTDPFDDARLVSNLASSVKDRAENLMIVDLLRNDLAKVSEVGSVRVPSLFDIETYPTIHQMTSTITSQLRAGLDLVDVICAMFPCGSITGAPKLRAMEIINEIEPCPRGPYTGSIGYFAPSGDGAFNVAIRTVRVDRATRGASMGVGSAIVADSLDWNEWAECLAKSMFLRGRASGMGR